jgi:outer membrane protein assembly factor BamA/autotransporter translocation and assembly factor TamB
MRRRLVLASLGLLLLLVVGVLVVHAPPARSLALRFAIRAALAQGLQLGAERLDYNLATRRVRLSGVTVSAAGDSRPFFTADEVTAIAATRVFFGEIVFDEVSVSNGAVRIVRSADGTSNLPKFSGPPSSEDPPALPIARVSAPMLAVEYRDEAADVTVRAPAVTVDLSSRGRVAIAAPVELSVGSTSTRVESFESDAAFDGRDLRLSNLRIEMPELSGRAEGVLALIRQQPFIDVQVSGDTELASAARWGGQTDNALRGGVHVEGTVRGPLGEPSADLQIGSTAISWQRLEVANVSSRLHLDADGLEIQESRAVVAGGGVNATGSLMWEGALARVNASWRDIDAAQLVTAFSSAGLTPSGRASGEGSARGSIDSIESWDVDARVALAGGERGRGRIPAPGEARFRFAAGEWALDASHRVGDVAPLDVALMGRLDGRDVRNSSIAGTLSVSESDLDAILQMLSETDVVSVQRDLVTGSIRVSAGVEGTVGQPVLQLVVDSDRATVAGQEIANLQARGRFDGSTFEVAELSAAQPAPGADAAGRVRATGQYDVKGQAYAATVTATGWRLVPTSDLPLAGLVNLNFSGNGRGRMVFGKAQLVSELTVSPDVALGEIVADADLQGDRVHITARAPAFNATADANIRLDAPYVATVRANAKALDLARAVSGLRLPVSIDGTADLSVEANGSFEQWREGSAFLQVSALDGLVESLPVAMREPARVRYNDGRVVVERLEATLGRTSVSAAGGLPVSSGASPDSTGADALLATFTGDVYDVAVVAAVAANRTTATSAQPPIAAGKGPLVLLARITGSLESPAYAADLEIGPGMVQARADLAPVENLVVRAHLENGLLELLDFAGSYHGARVAATGQAPLALLTGEAPRSTDGNAVLRARAVGVTSAVLNPLVDASTIGQVSGSLDARLDLSSSSLSLDDLEGEAVIDRLNLSVASLPVTQRGPTRVVARDGIARIETWAWESEGTSIDVSGQVHLGSRQAAIQANGKLDARLLTPFVGATGVTTAGQVETRVSITGNVTEPTINGDIQIIDGELRVREPRIVAGDLDATAVLARGNVFLTSLSGTVNGGMLGGSGQVQYSPELRGQFSVNATGMAMNFPEGLRTEVDSSIDFTTTLEEGEPSNRLSGLVTIRRGAYREPLALVAGVLNNLQRTGTTTGSPPSPFLQSLALDVQVVTDEDLTIDNNVARAQLGADLRVINVASSPALSGRAELREGGQLFLGQNTFTVRSGAIDFANPSAIEPILGIEATTRVSGVEIEVRISGPPDNLMTELTSPSDPDLAQADLTSLLLTGRRLDQLGEEEAAVVGAQVLGNLAGDVLGIAGRAVGLDTLRVGGSETNPRDPADLASETDPTSRVTFGKSLGSTLDVTLSQSLRESNDQTWIVDYLPVRRIALRFVSDDEDLRSYEFRHNLTFSAAPAAVRSGEASREVDQPRVSSIRFMGDLRFPEPQLRDLLRLEEGDRFDFIEWQADRDRLEQFYQRREHWASRVAARREESGGGVQLAYTVEAGPETRVQVSGMSLPGSAIEEIKTAWAQSVVESFLIEEAEEIVRRELASQGAYQPSFEIRFEGDESVRTLVIDVTPSPRAERIEVRLEGADDPLKSDLLDEVGGRANAQQAITNPRDYERTVVAALHARGYSQATVTVGVPIFEETIVAVPVNVNSGPQFRLGTVSFEGVTSLPLESLRAEAGIKEGGVYRANDVEAAQMRLQTRYRGEGFSTASVEARQQVRTADGLVDVAFAAREGPRQVIQDIAVEGLRHVAGDVARRALRLNTGDPLRTADWLEGRRRLFESGLFRRVNIDVEPLQATADTAPVRLRVTVEEWPALRLRYGFQVAEERPEENVNGRDLVPGVSADVTRRTLFGRAITVGAAAQYESLERVGRVFMNAPTLLGRPVQSSLALERSREESRIDTLVADRTTAAWEQRGRWRRLTASYGLRFERNHTFDTGPPDPITGITRDFTLHIGRLTSSATWDSRDDASDPTRGTFVSTSLEQGAGALGSDLRFVRSLTQAYHFRSRGNLVFASAARYGAVVPLGGQTLVSSLRFFAGGARTVRGVPEDSLGGLDFFGEPIGGRGLLTLNQEVRFPMYRWLRGVAFVDVGNVFPEVSGVRLRELVGSTGIGLRLVTPFALFRVDYGRTIWNRPAADSGRVVFGIGHTF